MNLSILGYRNRGGGPNQVRWCCSSQKYHIYIYNVYLYTDVYYIIYILPKHVPRIHTYIYIYIYIFIIIYIYIYVYSYIIHI